MRIPRKQKKEIRKIECLNKGWDSTSKDIIYKYGVKKNRYTYKMEHILDTSFRYHYFIIGYIIDQIFKYTIV